MRASSRITAVQRSTSRSTRPSVARVIALSTSSPMVSTRSRMRWQLGVEAGGGSASRRDLVSTVSLTVTASLGHGAR